MVLRLLRTATQHLQVPQVVHRLLPPDITTTPNNPWLLLLLRIPTTTTSRTTGPTMNNEHRSSGSPGWAPGPLGVWAAADKPTGVNREPPAVTTHVKAEEMAPWLHGSRPRRLFWCCRQCVSRLVEPPAVSGASSSAASTPTAAGSQCNRSSQWRSKPPGPLPDRRHGVCRRPHRRAAIRRSPISISPISYHAGPLSDLASAGKWCGRWRARKQSPLCLVSQESTRCGLSFCPSLSLSLSLPTCTLLSTLHVHVLLHMPVAIFGLRNTPRRLILPLNAAP
ncbi:hypothetical protein J3F83DRAFT_574762 [Trichoderma novae-zelandiae]